MTHDTYFGIGKAWGADRPNPTGASFASSSVTNCISISTLPYIFKLLIYKPVTKLHK